MMSVKSPLSNEGLRRNESSAQDELLAAAYSRVGAWLPYIAAFFLWIAGSTIFQRQGSAVGRESYAALFAGLVSAGVWALIRRKRIHCSDANWLTALLAGLVVFQVLVHPEPNGSPLPAMVLFTVMIACGSTLASRFWHSAVVVVTLAGWLAVTWPILTLNEYCYWALVLCSGAALSGLNLWYRLWKHRKAAKAPEPPNGETFHREFLERAVEGTQDGLWYWELQTNVFHFSPTWASLLGFEPAELRKHPDEWVNRVHPGYIARLRTEMAAHLSGEAPQFRNEHRMRRKDGTYMWVLARGTVVRNESGEAIVLAGSHSDITPLIEVEKRLLTDTFKDQLTGLANRSFLTSHLELAVAEKQGRGAAAPLFAVLFLDLDRFKFINDTMGHHVGDELLVAVAGRLRNCARPDDVVARFGGDEFVVLLRNLHDSEEAGQVGSRMLKALMTPFRLGDREIQSGGSIGIALSREVFSKSEEILHFGDVAMYESKRKGKGRVTLFHRGMMEESNKQELLQIELEQAVPRGELLMHYQPSVEMTTGKIVGAEALIRWRRPTGELLYPAEFLPLAEKSELIHQIGEWALRTACAQAKEWQLAGIAPVRVSVNLSARQFQQRTLPELVLRVLAETNLEPQWLELELTEAALAKSLDQSGQMLKELAELGIRTAIDNFGAGSASLTALRQYNVQTLKLDRGFVSELPADPKTAAVARGLITMAHHLGLAVVAEGVESRDQYQFLLQERCNQVQGYLTGRPSTVDDMLAMLQAATPMVVTKTPGSLEPDLNAMHAATVPTGALRWAAERKARESR